MAAGAAAQLLVTLQWTHPYLFWLGHKSVQHTEGLSAYIILYRATLFRDIKLQWATEQWSEAPCTAAVCLLLSLCHDFQSTWHKLIINVYLDPALVNVLLKPSSRSLRPTLLLRATTGDCVLTMTKWCQEVQVITNKTNMEIMAAASRSRIITAPCYWNNFHLPLISHQLIFCNILLWRQCAFL